MHKTLNRKGAWATTAANHNRFCTCQPKNKVSEATVGAGSLNRFQFQVEKKRPCNVFSFCPVAVSHCGFSPSASRIAVLSITKVISYHRTPVSSNQSAIHLYLCFFNYVVLLKLCGPLNVKIILLSCDRSRF